VSRMCSPSCNRQVSTRSSDTSTDAREQAVHSAACDLGLTVGPGESPVGYSQGTRVAGRALPAPGPLFRQTRSRSTSVVRRGCLLTTCAQRHRGGGPVRPKSATAARPRRHELAGVHALTPWDHLADPTGRFVAPPSGQRTSLMGRRRPAVSWIPTPDCGRLIWTATQPTVGQTRHRSQADI